MSKFINLAGKKFDFLTVLLYLGNQRWKCRCNCGKETIVKGQHLRNGSTKSCGCKFRIPDITGRRFGKLLALNKSTVLNSYDCKCDCGKIIAIRTSFLVSGKQKSCGCGFNFYRAQTCIKKYGTETPFTSPICMEKIKQTLLQKYGVDSPTKNHQLRLKAAKSANIIIYRKHWFSGETIECQGRYESGTIDYLNKYQIDYLWQVQTFTMPSKHTYTPDLYLPDSNLWVEIKGHWYADAKIKWLWFHNEYPNSEVWDEPKLKQLGIKTRFH